MYEKLIDLFVDAKRTDPEETSFTEYLADYMLSHGTTIQNWIPVTERLPGFEIERVLVMTKGDCILGYPKMDTDRYVNGRWVRYSDNVTHWMPLPEPPKEEDHG